MVKVFGLVLLLSMALYHIADAQAPCNNYVADPTDMCQTAPVVCELENYCNSMPLPVNSAAANICGTDISLDNPHWFSFIATANTVSVTITPTNCLAGGGGAIGLQGAIVGVCPSPFGGFFETIGSCQANPCATAEFTIGVGGVYEVGRQYWIMLDGCAGSICDYQVTATEGITAPVLDDPHFIVGTTMVCPGGSAAFTVDEPRLGRFFEWEINGEPITSSGRILFWDVPSGTPPGIYEVCLMNASSPCYNIVDDNGYVPGSICAEVEVVAIPETVVGPITICSDNAPYAIDGHYIFPPTTEYSYTLQTELNCDSTIRLQFDWIEYAPEEEIYYICEGELPLYHPVLGPITEIGTHFYPYSAQSNECDSSFYVTINELIFQVDVRVPRFDLQCPGQIIRADASNSKVILMPQNEELFNVFYSWFRNGNQVGNSPFLDITQAGTYTFRMVVAENGAVCSKEFTFTIQEFFTPPPVPVLDGPRTVCLGSNVTYTISNWDMLSTIIFSYGDCYDVISQTQNRVQLQFDSTCVDSLCVLVHKQGCPVLSNRTCIPIRVLGELQPQVTGDPYFCPGGSASLEASSGYQVYQWSGPDNFSSTQREINVSVPGLYQLIVEDNNACSGSTQIVVQERPFPDLDIAGSLSFCPGGQTQLFAVPSAYPSYRWSNGATTASITTNTAGNYTLEATDEFGCSTSRSVQITQQDSLTPLIGGDPDFCDGGSSLLDGGNGYVVYEWNGTNGSSTFLADRTGEVRLRVVDAFGCVGTTRVMVTEYPNPVASIDAPKMMICPAEDLVLQVNPAGMTRYEWSDGFIGRTRTINDVVDFDVTVTDGNGCIGTSSISIGVHTPPSPQVAGDTYFCEGLQALIGVVDPYTTYRWSDNNTNQNRPVSTAGRYSVTVTDGNGCTGETFFDVEERMNPRPVIQGDDEFCAGGNTVLTLTQAYSSYTWSGSGSGSSANYPVTTSGNYIVQVTDASGCIGSTNFVVTVHPNPVPQIAGSTTYCVGLSTTLDAGNYVSFNWAGPGGFTRTTRTVTISIPGNYSVTVTDVNGCTGNSNVTVTEETELSIGVDNPGRYCQGSTARISVQGTYASYRWSTGATTQAINVTAGSYTVTATDSDGCTGSQTVVVTEDPNPLPVISGPGTFCTGSDAQLDAGVWTAYAWSNGLGNGRTVTVAATGTYTVTVTDTNGCLGTASFFIRELASLEPIINGDPFFCAGSSTSLTVESGYQRYTWLDNSSTNPQRVFSAPGTFTIEVEDAQGCTGTGQVTVVENPLPVADAGADRFLICQRTEAAIGGPASSQGAFTYAWWDGDRGVWLGQATDRVTVDQAGNYVLFVTDQMTGCVQTDTVRVSRDPNTIQSINVEIQHPLCHGDANGRIEFTGVTGGTSPYAYFLQGQGLPGTMAMNLGPGTYTLLVTDDNGCSLTRVVTLINPDPISVDAGPDIVLEFGDPLMVIAGTPLPVQEWGRIRWESDNSVICDPCNDLGLETVPEKDGLYRIRLESINGCIAEDSLFVTLRRTRRVFIPGAFTPDRDGINDRFTLYGGKDLVNIRKMEIFDRWGNKLFDAEDLPPNDQEYGWEGTFRGMPLDPGVFLFSAEVEFDDGEIFSYRGEITILR
jgi:gliding motility-associated-like protein